MMYSLAVRVEVSVYYYYYYQYKSSQMEDSTTNLALSKLHQNFFEVNVEEDLWRLVRLRLVRVHVYLQLTIGHHRLNYYNHNVATSVAVWLYGNV